MVLRGGAHRGVSGQWWSMKRPLGSPEDPSVSFGECCITHQAPYAIPVVQLGELLKHSVLACPHFLMTPPSRFAALCVAVGVSY